MSLRNLFSKISVSGMNEGFTPFCKNSQAHPLLGSVENVDDVLVELLLDLLHLLVQLVDLRFCSLVCVAETQFLINF